MIKQTSLKEVDHVDYAMHELLEVQEIAAFKTICLTKSKTMKALVSDEKLKTILQHDVDASTRHLQDYNSLFSKVLN